MVNNEFQRIWKEDTAAKSRYYPSISPEGQADYLTSPDGEER
jgi:hypothetical protein